MNRKFVSRLLLIFPVAIIVYIVLFRWYYFIVYPVSVVNPYFYYQYSPGFWSVDFSFWLFTPLYFLWFRRNKAGTIVSLIYALCLDASAVGLFLMFFCFVYGIDPFTSAYYTYAFVLMFLFIIPIFDMHFSKQSRKT